MSSTAILLVGSTLLAFVLAALATPLVGAFARRLGMLDVPGGRRRHPRPIPRPGGLAIAVAFGLAIFSFWLVDRVAGGPFLIPEEVRSPRFTLTAIAALLGMSVGLDRKSTRLNSSHVSISYAVFCLKKKKKKIKINTQTIQ